jgi:tetratricopeptide (TPR) repeat protein
MTMFHRFQPFMLSGLLALCVCAPGSSQQTGAAKPDTRQQSKPQEAEPPEEDDSAKPKEYAFNPLQAEKELQVGEFYMKKGSYEAAVKRFTEATRWNPSLAEAYLRLGEAEEKFKDRKAAKDAYAKYLELAPDAKKAGEIKKKLSKL